MTIEMLNRGTILVSLGADDMQRFALNFDSDMPTDGLKNLMLHVGEVCGLDHRGKSYLIEALPSRSGCLLIVSVHRVGKRRVYRIKRACTREICVFFHADAMLDYLRVSQGMCGAVYRYGQQYVMLPSLSVSQEEIKRLSEYGELYPAGTAAAARVREYGTLLWQRQLQRRHISGGAVAVRDTALRDSGS